MINVILWSVLLLLTGADPVSAGPVAAAIGAISGWFAGLSPVVAAFVRIGVGLLLSALTKAKLPEPEERGITADFTGTGGDNSEHFVLGRYATGGVFVAPPLSWPVNDRRKRLVYVVDLGPAGQTINRMWIDGELAPFNGAPLTEFGGTLTRHVGFNSWASYAIYDGSQTAAPPFLMQAFGTDPVTDSDQEGLDPDFPWQSDMIGKGRLTYVGNYFLKSGEQSVWNGLPSLRFEVDGLPLYDPRQDSTQPGGSGTHRWGQPATYFPTNNPAVMIYNILRGITLPSGRVWGGGYSDADLPVANWAAAMNVCNETAAAGGGNTERRYRAGIQVKTADDAPATVIEKLLAACSGDIADEGGTVYIQVGEPALPLYIFTDDDLSANDPADLNPFPSRAETINALSISFPDPDAKYESVNAPRIADEDLITRDGLELPGQLTLEAVPYRFQAQRLGLAYLRDSQRHRTHNLVLPPDAAFVPPLSTVSWTSAANEYTDKLFQVERKTVDPRTYMTSFALRERDPADYDFIQDDILPVFTPPNTVTTPGNYLLPALTILPFVVVANGGQKLAGYRVTGVPEDVDQLVFEMRAAGASVPFASGVVAVTDGEARITGMTLRGASHDLRFRAGTEDVFVWSDWQSAGDITFVGVTLDDFDDEFKTAFDADDNLVFDAYFEVPTLWEKTGVTVEAVSNTNWNTPNALRLQGASSSFVIADSRPIRVKPGETLAGGYQGFVNAGGGNCFVHVRFSSDRDSSADVTVIPLTDTTAITGPGIATRTRSGISVPALARWARVQYVKGDNGTTDCYLGAAFLRKVVDRDLIKVGAVTDDVAIDFVGTTSTHTTGTLVSQTTGRHLLQSASLSITGLPLTGGSLSVHGRVQARKPTDATSSGQYRLNVYLQARQRIGGSWLAWQDLDAVAAFSTDTYEWAFFSKCLRSASDQLDIRLAASTQLLSGDDTALVTQFNLTDYVLGYERVTR